MTAQEERALFKECCLTGKKPVIERPWIISNLCRGCNQPVTAANIAIWHTYWKAMWAACHVQCRTEGMKSEAYECQILDKSCSDCRHFVRGKELTEVKGFGTGTFIGHCAHHNRTTFARACHSYPQNAECFSHRRG